MKAFLSNAAWKAAGSTPCCSKPEQLMVKVSPLPVESRDSVRGAPALGSRDCFCEKIGGTGQACEPLLPEPENMGCTGRQMVEAGEVS